MAASSEKSCNTSKSKSEKKQLEKLFDQAGETVKPYPQIDVQESELPPDIDERISRYRETPKGKLVKLAGLSSVGVLAAITLYAMISHDQEMLTELIKTARYILFGLLAWALGSTASNLFSRRGDKGDEEKEDSG